MQATRRIIHVDMDCFYAAVEMRERPELAGRPLAVGGASGRGVLTTCNYACPRIRRALGDAGFQGASELCPQLVIVPVRFELYREPPRARCARSSSPLHRAGRTALAGRSLPRRQPPTTGVAPILAAEIRACNRRRDRTDGIRRHRPE